MDVNLVMFKENGQRKEFPVKSKSCVVGRREDCDLRIPLPAISRRHCKFIKGDLGLELKDLASSNGTFVNNQRIQETILKAGDRVVVGPVVFIIQIDGDPADPKPVRTRLTKSAPPPKGGVVTPDKVAGGKAAPSSKAPAAFDPSKELGIPDGAGDELDPIAALEALAGAVGDAEAPTVDVDSVVELKSKKSAKK
jgi:pSer/pThr/pTyr-binding forkhead associated (FHA) protein